MGIHATLNILSRICSVSVYRNYNMFFSVGLRYSRQNTLQAYSKRDMFLCTSIIR